MWHLTVCVSDMAVHGMDKTAGPVELVEVVITKLFALKFFLCLLLFCRFFLKLHLFLVLRDGDSQPAFGFAR